VVSRVYIQQDVRHLDPLDLRHNGRDPLLFHSFGRWAGRAKGADDYLKAGVILVPPTLREKYARHSLLKKGWPIAPEGRAHWEDYKTGFLGGIDLSAGDGQWLFFRVGYPHTVGDNTYAFRLSTLMRWVRRVGFRPHDLMTAYSAADTGLEHKLTLLKHRLATGRSRDLWESIPYRRLMHRIAECGTDTLYVERLVQQHIRALVRRTDRWPAVRHLPPRCGTALRPDAPGKPWHRRPTLYRFPDYTPRPFAESLHAGLGAINWPSAFDFSSENAWNHSRVEVVASGFLPLRACDFYTGPNGWAPNPYRLP
jgi:hypothetical protein